MRHFRESFQSFVFVFFIMPASSRIMKRSNSGQSSDSTTSFQVDSTLNSLDSDVGVVGVSLSSKMMANKNNLKHKTIPLSMEAAQTTAMQALALTVQDWQNLGNAKDPSVAVPEHLSVVVECIMALLLIRVAAIALPMNM